MVFNFLRKSHTRKYPKAPHLNMVRGPDGKFIAAVNPDGTPVSPRPDIKNLRAVTEYVREANALNAELKKSALEDLAMKRDLSDMILDAAENEPIHDGDGIPSMEQMFMQFLMNPQAMAALKQPKPHDDGWGPTPNAVPQHIIPNPVPRAAHIEQEERPQAEGVDRLNMVLKALSKLPIDRVNEGVVKKVAQSEGIDYDALVGTIRKLHPVVVAHG